MAPLSKDARVTVFGGSGFLGRYVVRALARRGYRVLVAVRRPDLANYLRPLGTVGQIEPIQANLRVRWSVDRALESADAAVNLVGILYQAGKQSFDAVQAFGPRAVAEAARAQGIDRVVHVSAIGADANSPIAYQRSKGEGEAAVQETIPEAIIMRPSIIFGTEDEFFNRFADMTRTSPFLPAIGGGKALFQPVYVTDVAEAIADAIDGTAQSGATYELGGPEVVTFKQCLQLVLDITRRKRAIVPIPFGAAKLMGRVMGVLPKPPLTYDQVRMLESDNIVSDAATAAGLTLEGLGIDPTAMEVILPTYLDRFREYGQFSKMKSQAPESGE